MTKFNAILLAVIASLIMTGTVLADQTDRDEQEEFEAQYLNDGE